MTLLIQCMNNSEMPVGDTREHRTDGKGVPVSNQEQLEGIVDPEEGGSQLPEEPFPDGSLVLLMPS